MPSNHLIFCRHFSSCPQSFPASGSFQMSQLFTSGGQSIGASASASVFPMNIQGWFSLGLTGLISLLSERLSRVFCSTTVWKYKFFGIQPSLKICLKFRRPGFNSWVNKMTWRRKQQPTPVFLPGESHGRGAWQATVCRVANSHTQLSMHTLREKFCSKQDLSKTQHLNKNT